MSISIDSGLYSSMYESMAATKSSSDLSSAISAVDKDAATDEELMSVCKSFEAYLTEQVIKSMEKTVMKAEHEEGNEYMDMFKDNLNQGYSELMTNNLDLGIAKTLFNAMKQN